jgi:hypothetical protein
MVKTVYTEKTPLQPTDFTSFAGAGAEAWSQQLGHLSDEAYQEAHTLAMSDAALNGMEEGLKGTDAETTSNLTEVQRKYNNSVISTAGSVIVNQSAQAAAGFYNQAIQDNGNGPKAVQQFNQAWGAYNQKAEKKLPRALVPTFQKAALMGKRIYEGRLIKGAASQSAQNQKFMDQSQINSWQGTLNTLMGNRGVVYNPKELKDNNSAINQALYFNSQTNLTGLSRAKNDQNIRQTVAKGFANNLATNQVRRIRELQETKPPDAEEKMKGYRQVLSDMNDVVKSNKWVEKAIQDYPILGSLGEEGVRKYIMASGEKAVKGFAQIGVNAQNQYENGKATVHNHRLLSSEQINGLNQISSSLTTGTQAKLKVLLANDANNKVIDLLPLADSTMEMVDAEEKKGNFEPRKFSIWRGKKAQADSGGLVYMSNYRDLDRASFDQTNMSFDQDFVSTNLITSTSDSYFSNYDTTNSTLQQREFTRQRNALVYGKEIANGTYPAFTKNGSNAQYNHYGTLLNSKTMPDLISDLRAKKNAGLDMNDLAKGFTGLQGEDGFSQEVVDKLVTATFAAQAKNETTATADADALEAFPDMKLWASATDSKNAQIITGNVFESQALNNLRGGMRPGEFESLKKLWAARYLAKQHGDSKTSLDADQDDMNESLNNFLTDHGIYASTGTGSVDLPMMVSPYGSAMPHSERAQGLTSHNIAISYPLPDPTHRGQSLDIKPGALIRGMAAWTSSIRGKKDYALRTDETEEDIADGQIVSINPTTFAFKLPSGLLLMRRSGKGKNTRVEPYTLSTYQMQQVGTPQHG